MLDDETPDDPDPQDFTDPSPNPEGDTGLAILADALQEHGVTLVVVCYEGSGDSGAVGEVAYTPPNVSLPKWLEVNLRDVAEGYCPDSYENNEGGYGTLTIYPCLGLAELEHHDRYEDSESIDTQPVALPRRLARPLSRLGIMRITAHFDGYGDSGQMEELTVEPESAVLDGALEDELQDFLLDQLPGGWEINEGSYGEFTIDVTGGQVEVDAYWRVEKDSDPQVTHWQWR
jgi:hypothetical protein